MADTPATTFPGDAGRNRQPLVVLMHGDRKLSTRSLARQNLAPTLVDAALD